MINIDKPAIVPQKLIDAQNSIAKSLYEKKEKFRWNTEHYSTPIKTELKEIYRNKCGFCEIILTENDAENKFTVEHFRPKSHYYWLGNEWTNLFPACRKCNYNKDDNFPLLRERKRIKLKDAPFDNSGNLNRESCNANHLIYKKEQALFLHPEIDNPEKYFKFEPSGKVVTNEENLTTSLEREQAKKMIAKFLNRSTLEEKRKYKIIKFRERLTNLLIIAMPLLKEEYTETNIKFLFLDFFTDLQKQQEKEAEFSRLGYYMAYDFQNFFLNYIETEFGKEVKDLVNYAYNLFVE